MAQARVSDFFAAKKRSNGSQASKRRKLDVNTSEATTSSELKSATIENAVAKDREQATVVVTKKEMAMQDTKKPRTRRASRSRVTARKKLVVVGGQMKLQEAFAHSSGSASDSDSQASTGPDEATEEVTSCWDEHDGPQTPRKRIRPMESLELPEATVARPSRRKLVVRRQDIEQDGESTKQSKQDQAASVRKKLTLFQDPKKTEKKAPVDKSHTDGNEKQCSATEPAPVDKDVHLPSMSELQQELAPSSTVPHSPLPQTPELSQASPVKKTKTVTSPKLKASMDKCKTLAEGPVPVEGQADAPSASQVKTAPSKKEKILAPEVLRERLAKCGKLETLKAKLAEMNSSLRAVRKIEEDKKKVETEAKPEVPDSSQKEPEAAVPKTTEKTEAKPAPAYERYEYLAKEGVPTLSLPGKFQRLLTMFQGTDTVVSMLYNRQETITFSKLQTAVQSMTRKNFEQKTLGQIKTVYPTAYNLRQEKNIPSFGTKTSGYQLTVEPNLTDCAKDGTSVNEDGRPTFTATALLKRKRIFHGSLLDIVKDHHADFLSKLNPPVSIPSSKLTRWHPRFPLDSVPDIETATLPAPPVQVYQTARQVLENSRGKVPNRVEAALEKVAGKSEVTKADGQSSSQTSSPKPVSSAHKGIPLSLLEKIRAKEAAKIQAALTRDPAEDRKTDMMGRLPALIRSLRTHYVTEKKPTLPLGSVVQKLADSYATCISHADVEAHLKLLQELAPKWIQIVEITRGKFVKIDKNADIAEIINKITNLAKSRR